MFEQIDLYEWIGYAASLTVAISLSLSSIVKFRIINLIGAMTFVAYGFLIGSLPIAFMNIFITVMDVYYLYKIFAHKEKFEILEVEQGNKYLKRFISFHKNDIKKFTPAFEHKEEGYSRNLVILRNMNVTGVLMANEKPKNGLLIELDYATPEYRDFKNAGFLFDYLKEKGYRYLESDSGSPKHQQYLKRLGFKPADGLWVLFL